MNRRALLRIDYLAQDGGNESSVSIAVTMGVVSTPMPLVCSASYGEGSDYNLVPTSKGHYLLK